QLGRPDLTNRAKRQIADNYAKVLDPLERIASQTSNQPTTPSESKADHTPKALEGQIVKVPEEAEQPAPAAPDDNAAKPAPQEPNEVNQATPNEPTAEPTTSTAPAQPAPAAQDDQAKQAEPAKQGPAEESQPEPKEV